MFFSFFLPLIACGYSLNRSTYAPFFRMLMHFEGKNEVEFLRVCFISFVGKRNGKDLVSKETLVYGNASLRSLFWFSGV